MWKAVSWFPVAGCASTLAQVQREPPSLFFVIPSPRQKIRLRTSDPKKHPFSRIYFVSPLLSLISPHCCFLSFSSTLVVSYFLLFQFSSNFSLFNFIYPYYCFLSFSSTLGFSHFLLFSFFSNSIPVFSCMPVLLFSLIFSYSCFLTFPIPTLFIFLFVFFYIPILHFSLIVSTLVLSHLPYSYFI